MFELVNVSCEGLNSVLLTWGGGGRGGGGLNLKQVWQHRIVMKKLEGT